MTFSVTTGALMFKLNSKIGGIFRIEAPGTNCDELCIPQHLYLLLITVFFTLRPFDLLGLRSKRCFQLLGWGLKSWWIAILFKLERSPRKTPLIKTKFYVSHFEPKCQSIDRHLLLAEQNPDLGLVCWLRGQFRLNRTVLLCLRVFDV